MSLDLSSYKVASGSTGDSTKLNNGYDAIQNFVNALPIANLAGYPADATKFLRGDGQWVSGCKITTSAWSGGPPGSPADTDIWIATSVDANGTRWAFQYNAGSGSTYKWEFIGGPAGINSAGQPGVTQVLNAGTQIGATGYWYRNTTPFPYVTVARGGDYEVQGIALLGFTANTSAWLAARGFGQQAGGDALGNAEPLYSFNDSAMSAGAGIGHQINDIVLSVVAGGRVGFCGNSSIVGTCGFYGWNVKVRPVRIA